MKNKNPKSIEAAQRELKAAEQKYEKLIRDRRQKNAVQIKEHQQNCMTALAEKRFARIRLNCLMTGKPVPEAAEMLETKAIATDTDKKE